MFKEKGSVIFLAVLVIVISAALSGLGTYYFLKQRSPQDLADNNSSGINTNKKAPVADITKADSFTKSEETPKDQVQTETMSTDTQKAAKTLGDFYYHLDSGVYDEAAKLVDWQYVSNDLLKEVFGITSGFDNQPGILKEICSQNGTKTKIKILSVKEPTSGESLFFFSVNYLENDGQVYVSSSRVAGQFINETKFVIEVIKKGENFFVRTLPGMTIVE